MHVQYRRVREAWDSPLILRVEVAAGSTRRTPSFWGRGAGCWPGFCQAPRGSKRSGRAGGGRLVGRKVAIAALDLF